METKSFCCHVSGHEQRTVHFVSFATLTQCGGMTHPHQALDIIQVRGSHGKTLGAALGHTPKFPSPRI